MTDEQKPAGHTPGPWQTDCDPHSKRIKTTHGLTVADTWSFDVGPLEAATNAKLIAAAPDMLAVLQELAESAVYWSEYDVPLGIVDRLNSVIRKATT